MIREQENRTLPEAGWTKRDMLERLGNIRHYLKDNNVAAAHCTAVAGRRGGEGIIDLYSSDNEEGHKAASLAQAFAPMQGLLLKGLHKFWDYNTREEYLYLRFTPIMSPQMYCPPSPSESRSAQ